MVELATPDDRLLIEDLRRIAKVGWVAMSSCVALMEHPLVEGTAAEPKGPEELAAATRVHFRKAIKQLRDYEKNNPPKRDRSVAFAARRLLRLEKRYATVTLGKIREEIANKWHVSPGGFRQRHEVKHVYEPLMAAFAQHAQREFEAAPEKFKPSARKRTAAFVANQLRDMEKRWHQARLDSLMDEGLLVIRSEDEMLEVLLMLNEAAKHGFTAVDYARVNTWFENHRLKKYLDNQLERVGDSEGNLSLERVRMVSREEEADKKMRTNLIKLIELHEAAGARLLLCPPEALEGDMSFPPHKGLLIIDLDTEPVAVTGELGARSVGEACVFTRGKELEGLKNDYEALKAKIEANDYTRAIRARLGLA
jgi:hypothetical protein